MRPEAPKKAFGRSAPADVWRQTLSGIPSIFGRLIYLSALRTAGGTYEHHGFVETYGADVAQAALLNSHENALESWLNFNLEQQKADVDLYLSDLMGDREKIVETWLKLVPFRHLVPATARDSERRLFQSDLEILLEILRKQYKLQRPDPES